MPASHRLRMPTTALVAAVLSSLAIGQESPRYRAHPAMVQPARKGEQKDLILRREQCSVDPGTLAAIGRGRGEQVRVRRGGGEVAVYTVAEIRDEGGKSVVRMGRAGRQRLGSVDAFEVEVESRVPHPGLTEAEARARGELIERLIDDGTNTGLLVLAPHGGQVEIQTDRQADLVVEQLGRHRASAWICQGYDLRGVRGAFERWHITSTDIHEASYPALRRLSGRRFAHAVSFHGHGAPNVLIGGGAPVELRRAIAEVIRHALREKGIPVEVAGEDDELNGDDPRNIVNRYVDGTGIQIEQSGPARREHGALIADAVARFYRERLEGR